MKAATSNCEEEFVKQILRKSNRIDGRSLHDGRVIDLAFGDDGCCIVVLGNTRVMSQVTSDVTVPRPSRPAEGILNVNFELSPMAAPHFKTGRMSDAGIEAARLLERCIRDSKCIDLESLCIVAGSKVWTIRVDMQALNDDGNLLECASVAAISSLAHFKRPHVSVVGNDVTIQSLDDHEPSPLTLHHMPVIVNLALFEEENVILVDPIELEERIALGKIVIGVNAHQEVCSLHLSGAVMLKKETVLKCSNIAIKRAQMLTQVIRAALDSEKYKKATKQPTGFVSLLRSGTILSANHPIKQILAPQGAIDDDEVHDITETELQPERFEEPNLILNGKAKQNAQEFLSKTETALFEGGPSRWSMSEESSDDDSEDCNKGNNKNINVKEEKIDRHCENSEEETVTKHFDTEAGKDAPKRGWYQKNVTL